jgi:osmotically-inducible protein OsmY
MGYELDKLKQQYGVASPVRAAYTGPAAPTTPSPAAPTELVKPTDLRTAPIVPTAPTKLPSNATQAQKDAYNVALQQYTTNKAAYDADLAKWKTEKAAYDTALKTYTKALPGYEKDFAKYTTEKTKFDETAAKYNLNQQQYDAYRNELANRMGNTPMYGAEYNIGLQNTPTPVNYENLLRAPDYSNPAIPNYSPPLFSNPDPPVFGGPVTTPPGSVARDPITGGYIDPITGEPIYRTSSVEMAPSAPTQNGMLFNLVSNAVNSPEYKAVYGDSVSDYLNNYAHGGAVHDMARRYNIGGSVRYFKKGGDKGEYDDDLEARFQEELREARFQEELREAYARQAARERESRVAVTPSNDVDLYAGPEPDFGEMNRYNTSPSTITAQNFAGEYDDDLEARFQKELREARAREAARERGSDIVVTPGGTEIYGTPNVDAGERHKNDAVPSEVALNESSPPPTANMQDLMEMYQRLTTRPSEPTEEIVDSAPTMTTAPVVAEQAAAAPVVAEQAAAAPVVAEQAPPVAQQTTTVAPIALPPATTTPVSPAAEDLMSMLSRYENKESVYGPELKAARARASAETDAFTNMISKAMQGDSEKPSKAEMYFRLAAAFGSPTKTGAFGENLALASKEMAEYAKDMRTSAKTDKQLRLQLALEAQKIKSQTAREDLTTLRGLAGEEMKDKRALLMEYIKSGRPQSEAGKAATDAGLKQGTPQFNDFVNKYIDDKIRSGNLFKEAMVAISAGNLGVARSGLDIRESAERRQQAAASKLTPKEVELKLQAETTIGSLDDSMSSLKRAYELNPQTFDGTLFSTAQRKLLEQTNPKDPRVLATREQSNLLSKGAVDKLRASFGGNPTEGERAALLALEGLDAKSKDERAKIMQNTYRLLKARREREQKRLDEISKGSYRETTPEGGID